MLPWIVSGSGTAACRQANFQKPGSTTEPGEADDQSHGWRSPTLRVMWRRALPIVEPHGEWDSINTRHLADRECLCARGRCGHKRVERDASNTRRVHRMPVVTSRPVRAVARLAGEHETRLWRIIHLTSNTA